LRSCVLPSGGRSLDAALAHPRSWGVPPWNVDFRPTRRPLPAEVDFAVIGAGFTGLAAAAWLRHIAPDRTAAIFEASSLGAGSSGRSGGMALAESSVGGLPGLGDVLAGFEETVSILDVNCDSKFPGVWEIARQKKSLPHSPIDWSDSGNLRAVGEVPGGAVDPGKLVAGLARAAERLGASIHEHTPLDSVLFEDPLRLVVGRNEVRTHGLIFATNAQSLELNGLAGRSEPKFTLAVATAPLTASQLDALGLASQRPFYTVDFPYLWGRFLENQGVVFGAGLVHVDSWRDLASLDVSDGESATLIARLERRVRGLVPAVRDVEFTHRWGGPILIAEGWRPVFARHPESPHALVLGAYSGQGVTLGVHLGRWAAEAMLGRRALPAW